MKAHQFRGRCVLDGLESLRDIDYYFSARMASAIPRIALEKVLGKDGGRVIICFEECIVIHLLHVTVEIQAVLLGLGSGYALDLTMRLVKFRPIAEAYSAVNRHPGPRRSINSRTRLQIRLRPWKYFQLAELL